MTKVERLLRSLNGAKAINMPNNLTHSQLAIEEYLKGPGFSRIDPIIPGQLAMRGSFVTDGVTFDTVVSIPPNVPPAYPTFHLVNTDYVFRQPHIERPRPLNPKIAHSHSICRVCLRKENEKTYNPNPVDLFHGLFNRFQNLCGLLARGEFNNEVELFSEFDSYWAQDITVHWFMKSEPRDRMFLSNIILSKEHERISIVTDDIQSIEKFATAAEFTCTTQKILYIDLGNFMTVPLPYTYGDFLKILKNSGHYAFIKSLTQSDAGAKLGSLLVFGFNLPDGARHYANISLPIVQPYKQNKKWIYPSTMNNFFSMSNQKMFGGHIKSLDRGWLMKRGGNEFNMNIHTKNKKIAIAGCGSIGSSLAYKLSKSGISNMILIDPGILKSFNIGRHHLGMSDVHLNKAETMAKELQKQFIDVSIEAVPHGIESEEARLAIKNVDLLITAIGSDAPAIEPWLANLTIKGELPNMVACWLEADAIAGHAVSIQQQTIADLESIIDAISILPDDYASTLLQEEVGCNSQYMPYGYIDADLHINRMAKFILNILDGQKIDGITSIGDIVKHTDHLKRKIYPGSVEEIRYETLDI